MAGKIHEGPAVRRGAIHGGRGERSPAELTGRRHAADPLGTEPKRALTESWFGFHYLVSSVVLASSDSRRKPRASLRRLPSWFGVRGLDIAKSLDQCRVG